MKAGTGQETASSIFILRGKPTTREYASGAHQVNSNGSRLSNVPWDVNGLQLYEDFDRLKIGSGYVFRL